MVLSFYFLKSQKGAAHLLIFLIVLAAIVFGYYFYNNGNLIKLQNAEATTSTPPNIVLILTDDQADGDLQFMPKTNVLVGDQGVRFTNYYTATANCCPSRSTLLTGLYARKHDIIGNSAPEGGATLFNDSSTLATWLSSVGYRTGLFGKYLNNYSLLDTYIPPGWSDWFALSNESYYNYNVVDNGTKVFYGTDPSDYSTYVLRDRVVQFIESTPVEQPFFVYFSPKAPHEANTTNPYAVPAPEDDGTMSDVAPYRPPNYNEEDVSDKPLWIRQQALWDQAKIDDTDLKYQKRLESLQSVDRAVETIVNTLIETGRIDNTIIIFASDNGFSLGSHRWLAKQCPYEECSNVPLLVRAPGVAPRTDDSLVVIPDITASIKEWAGINDSLELDGRSFVELLTNPAAPQRDHLLLEELGIGPNRNYQAVVTKDYMYGEYANMTDVELYNLNTDPFQLQNLATDSTYNTVISDLKDKLYSYKISADLAANILRASPNPVEAGSDITYEVSATNNSSIPAHNLTLKSTLSSNTTFVSCTSSTGICRGSGLIRNVFFTRLKPGESAAATIVAKVKTGVANGTEIPFSVDVVPFDTSDPDTSNDSASATVTVGDITGPVVSITSPEDGSIVPRGTTITISANATDPSGVAKVEFYVNGNRKCTDTTSPFTCDWKVPSRKNFQYPIEARAFDNLGNINSATIIVTSSN